MSKFIEHSMFWFIIIACCLFLLATFINNIIISLLGMLFWAVGSWFRDIYIYPAMATTKQIFTEVL